MNYVFSKKFFFNCLLLLAVMLLAEACSSKPVTKTAAVGAISPIDLKRLEFAQQAIFKLNQDWKLDESWLANTCIVLFGNQQEWLLNCVDPLVTGTIAVSTFNGRPVYFTPQSLSIPNASVPYVRVASSIVAQATVLTPYQQKTYGLNGPPFILIQKLEDLVEHHPGFPKESTHTEEILAIYAHEFFHILQFKNPTVSEFIDRALEKKCFVDQSELKTFYESNQGYQNLIKSEYQLLNEYLQNESLYSKESAKAVLRNWLGLYQKRIHDYSAPFSKKNSCRNLKWVDSFWTFVEGTARYVENQFYINPKIREGVETLKEDSLFAQFSFIERLSYQGLPTANKKIGAKYYYAIGSQLSFILDIAAHDTWKKKSFTNPNWLIGAVESAVK